MSPDWSSKEEPVPYAKLGDPQSLNLYAYVLNHPTNGVDPDGHDFQQEANQNWIADHQITNSSNEQLQAAGLVRTAQQQGSQNSSAQTSSGRGDGNGSSGSGKQDPNTWHLPTGTQICGDFYCDGNNKHLGALPAAWVGNSADASLGDALMFVPAEKLGTIAGGIVERAAGDLAAKAAESLFARGGKGLLNSNDYLRIGYGWQGSAKAGSNVFRIGIGSRRLPVHIHITLWKF